MFQAIEALTPTSENGRTCFPSTVAKGHHLMLTVSDHAPGMLTVSDNARGMLTASDHACGRLTVSDCARGIYICYSPIVNR